MAPKRAQTQAKKAAEQREQAAPPSAEGKAEQHEAKEQRALAAEPSQADPADQTAATNQQQEDNKPAPPASRGRRKPAKPAPAKPEGVTKRTTRTKQQAVKKEVPAEGAEPKPSRSRRPAPKKPACRSRAPTSKRATQKEDEEEQKEPAIARKAAAPARSRAAGGAGRSRAAAPKNQAAPRKVAATPRKRAAAPARRRTTGAATSRSRGARGAAKKDEETEGVETEQEQQPRKRAARAPARGRGRGRSAAKETEEAGPSEGEGGAKEPPTRRRGETASKRAPRKPAARSLATKPRRPAPKRKQDEAEAPGDKGATPTPEDKAGGQEGIRTAKRQRVTKVPKGAAPSPDSEAMAAMQMLSKEPPAELFVWGSNPFGGLGLGEEETLKFRPTQVPVPNVHFVEVVCGGMHTVALSTTGEVWTWGVNDEGALGRKTLGTAWEAHPDSEKADEKVPGRAVLPDGIRMVQIAAGDGFTVTLSPTGAVYGCGTFKDDVGGLSGFTDTVKVQSMMTLLHNPIHPKDEAVKLVAGARHCAILTRNGTVMTWGIGSQGQLGRLPAFDANSPPSVSELFVPKPVCTNSIPIRPTSIATIASGAYSTFVISKAGDVVAWGLNNSCQLGIDKGDEQNNLVWEPTKVTSISKVSAIKGGEQHTLILSKDGRLFSCGAPTYGMLGRQDLDVNNANDKFFKPEPVHGFDQPQEWGKAITHLEAGTNISACTQEDGTAWLWGSQVNYQLAKGDTEEDALVPEKLKRTKTFGFRKIYSISFGGQHAALLAGPQGEPPAPEPEPAAPPKEDGACPSHAAPAPAANGTTIAAQSALNAVNNAVAAPQPSIPPAPAPSGVPVDFGTQQALANPAQSAVEAAMAWAQQVVNSGGIGGLTGGLGASNMPSAGTTSGVPAQAQEVAQQSQPQQQAQPEQQQQQQQQQQQRPFLEGAKAEERAEAALEGGEGGVEDAPVQRKAEVGKVVLQQESQAQPQMQQRQEGPGTFLEGANYEERAEAAMVEGEGGTM